MSANASPSTGASTSPSAGAELYVEPSYYRMLFDGRQHDVGFYSELCGRERVLELGVGTGRVALPLARAGARIVGVDRSADMLAALEQALALEPPDVRARVTTHCADARTLALGERFARVTCPFNGIAHHHRAEELAAFFASVRRHLAPDGLFAFDAMLPEPSLLAGQSSSVPWFRHPRTGEVCRCDEHIRYEPLSQVLGIQTTLTPRAGGPVQRLELQLRQFFPEETLLLLAHHGFEVVRRVTELGDAIGYVCRMRPEAA